MKRKRGRPKGSKNKPKPEPKEPKRDKTPGRGRDKRLTIETRKPSCLERGFDSRCREFRQYINEKSGPKPEGGKEGLAWHFRRYEIARDWLRENGFDVKGPMASDLFHHVPVNMIRGRRPCNYCLTVEIKREREKGGNDV